MVSMAEDIADVSPSGEEQLEAVVRLVRRLAVAATSGPHGERTKDHDRQFCDSCRAVSEARGFLQAMSGDESVAEAPPLLVTA